MPTSDENLAEKKRYSKKFVKIEFSKNFLINQDKNNKMIRINMIPKNSSFFE
jgi:hypothetical protein